MKENGNDKRLLCGDEFPSNFIHKVCSAQFMCTIET